MTNPKTLFTSSAAIALLSGSAAFADISAQEAWQSFQDFGARYGQRVTGDESMSGGVLTVSNVEMAMTVPEADIKATIGDLIFTEQGDGTVLIETGPQITYKMDVDPEEGESVSMTIVVTQEGMKTIASAEGDKTAYDFSADMLTMEFVDFDVEGEEAELNGSVTMSGLDGKYEMTDSDMVNGLSETNIEETTYAVTVIEDGEGVNLSGSIQNLTSEAVFAIPSTMDPADFTAMLKAGLNIKGSYAYDSYELNMDIESPTEAGTVVMGASNGALDLELNEQTIDYGGAASDVTMQISGMQIPFPQIDVAFEKVGGRFQIPVGAEEAGDFAMKLELVGLTVSEQIWGMFDPTAVLPRDPATLVIDTTGKLRWLFDLFDPEAAELVEATGGQPAEIEALDINELVLSLIGANLTGNGSFTFDNSDTTTFPGMPAPSGSVSLNLQGANAVMDNLVKLGFVPQDQVMGVRMMLGMFARPGAGADELVSEIQVTKDGQVLANGQRLR
ncbi:DUF2125 domain-containing protein [Actibacterium pelagium]|uniref:DUF2125 domain-containing protein n=1 Tax=Actibacterium pelagium TaxID=2029103 RepID=A0A917AJY9_9RHOB|nr:DUF2125 domain-containing protein [Actibacterium pelagium]GGE56248.1 hypothetical protein GCM10011517_24860 [Actibacterium pelagium]